MLSTIGAIDLAVIAGYLILCVVAGIKLGGRPGDPASYFKTDGTVPWWAASFSIVATETSLLTVISIPVVAYLGSLVFLQLVAGYVIGRILVAFLILPSYFSGSIATPYEWFQDRFGGRFRSLSSVVFLITRLLADGVRLFAAAIPLKLITGLEYPIAIALIAILTLSYTYFGGLRSVIWIDVLQLIVYTAGAGFIIWYITTTPDILPFSEISEVGKTAFLTMPESVSDVFFTPYNLIGAMLGGIFLTMASHGTDHLIVQRLLACNNLKLAKRALITSGFFVFIQFLLFLVAGLFVYSFYQGATPEQLGVEVNDEILIRFVVQELPAGAKGLFIAGLFAAAMSTLSSSLSALSSSTFFDLFPKLAQRPDAMRISRMMMIVWTLVFILFASMFTSTENPIVELGLGIAGFTYGALLGAFLNGIYTKIESSDAVAGLFICVAAMTVIIFFTPLAWPWYTLTGLIIFSVTAHTSSFIRGFVNLKS